MPDPVACLRHPQNQTRLRCATCEDPICPQCAVQTPVGQKCPTDAKQPRSARAQGTPKQLIWGVAYGFGAAVVLAVVLVLILRGTGGFLAILGAYFAGYGVGEAVRKGAQGNASDRFRWIAMVASGVMMLGVWVGGFGVLLPGGLTILSYPAAVYGAAQRFPWR